MTWSLLLRAIAKGNLRLGVPALATAFALMAVTVMIESLVFSLLYSCRTQRSPPEEFRLAQGGNAAGTHTRLPRQLPSIRLLRAWIPMHVHSEPFLCKT